MALLSPIAIWAEWNNGALTGVSGPYSYDIGNNPLNGFNIPNGGSENIRQWSGCKRVIIAAGGCGTGAGLFVPTRTQTEWFAFLSNPPACATITAPTNGNVGTCHNY